MKWLYFTIKLDVKTKDDRGHNAADYAANPNLLLA